MTPLIFTWAYSKMYQATKKYNACFKGRNNRKRWQNNSLLGDLANCYLLNWSGARSACLVKTWEKHAILQEGKWKDEATCAISATSIASFGCLLFPVNSSRTQKERESESESEGERKKESPESIRLNDKAMISPWQSLLTRLHKCHAVVAITAPRFYNCAK